MSRGGDRVILDNQQIAELKTQYLGQRVMVSGNMTNDPAPLQFGDAGKVIAVDDVGTLHVKWDSGRALGLVPSDPYVKLPKIAPGSGKWVDVWDWEVSIDGLTAMTLASYQPWEVAEFLAQIIKLGNKVTLVSKTNEQRVQL